MIASALVAGVLACILTLLLVPLVIRLAHRWQLLDRPGPLKIHTRPVPRLGGVALVAAISLAVFAAQPRLAAREWPFFAALALVWLAGLIDDVRSLSVLGRLVAQVAGGTLLWFHGWRVTFAGDTTASLLATVALIVGFVNAANFLDGGDGLAAGVAGLIAGAYMLTGVLYAGSFMYLLACAIVAACLGFLAYNFPPAKIFLGDSGSTSLGLCLAFLGLDFWRSGAVTSARLVFAFLVASLPLLDAAFAILRRLSGGLSPLYGDRRHVYDQMLARGWSQRSVALACYGFTAAFATIALWGVRYQTQGFWPIAILSVVALAAYAVKLGCLQAGGEQPSREVAQREIGTSQRNSAGYN